MENSSKHNDSITKSTKRVVFNSRTFNSKLFLKLVGDFIDPSIVCIQTLRYEPENRKLDEIEKAIPWLNGIQDLNKFISLKETPESSHKLLIELTWILFYNYYEKNSILKKAAENEDFVYILLGGKIAKLNIVYEKESLTLEDYLIYLLKMKIINEKEIINKCRILNSFYADINGNNLYKFCKENPQFNYEKLKEMARNEIIDLGFKIEDFHNNYHEHYKINSLQNYLKISSVKKRQTIFTEGIKATPRLYLGKYVIVGYIKRGQGIGNLTEQHSIDNSTYVCIDNCDIAFVNKKKSHLKKLCKLVIEKKKKIFSELKNEFYIFRQITDNTFYNEIVPHFEYKQFHQGERIFLQGSLYDGIYLLKEGIVDIYLNSSINEIGNFISSLKNSLCGFKEYISSLNIDKNGNFSEEEIIKPKIFNDQTYLTKEKNDILNEKNQYEVLTISQYNIFGTNELFDYKTGIYYFSAECMSEEAIIYFLPKKFFYSLLIKEKPFYLSLAQRVESKAKYIIGKLKNHIKIFEEVMNKKYKKFTKTKKINPLSLKDITITNYKSIKNLKKTNITTIDTKIEINKKDENSFEFPPLLKTKKEKKDNKYLFTENINSFSSKDKFHKTMIGKEMFNKYKKINLRLLQHPKAISLKNNKVKKGKSIECKKSFNKYNLLKLPSNFPFKIQNSYYKPNYFPKDNYCSFRKSYIFNY
jgi:CRP-like cAMP-binding protein